MDSGNSGSISSSDEEYDSSSHADPSSLFLISQPQQPSLVPSMFDLSSTNTYLQALSQTHQNQNILNLDCPRSEPNCNLPQSLPSSSTPNQYLSKHDNIMNTTTQQSNNNVVVRNSKKRSRASRRAPTTVLTTDTTNFRSMVQEFTGIPAPPFSPSFSRRIHLRPNPLLSSSSRTPLLHNNVNVFSPNNNNSNNSSINYQLLPDLSLPYHPQNNNLMQQNHPIPSFHPSSSSSSLHSFVPQGFGAKSLPNMPSLHDHAHMMGAHGHEHVVSEGMFLKSVGDVGNNNSLNHEKNIENCNSSSGREGGGAVETWICSSDHQ